MKRVISSLLIIVIMFFLVGCTHKCEVTEDEHNFKVEYEELNGKKEDGNEYLEITIPEDNNIKYVDAEEVISFMKNGTGVIYFGFPECPWCRNAIPVFLEVSSEYAPCEILYFNALDIRDQKHLEDGEVIVDKEGSKEYYEILELLGDKADVYDGLEDDSIKRLYFPTMVFVKNGEIIGTHMATVDSQTDPSKALTKKQQEELKGIYEELFEEVKSNMCKETAC